MMQSVRTAAQ